jgi:hypothetical protein
VKILKWNRARRALAYALKAVSPDEYPTTEKLVTMAFDTVAGIPVTAFYVSSKKLS